MQTEYDNPPGTRVFGLKSNNTLGNFHAQEKENTMDTNINQNEVAPAVSPEEAAKLQALMEEMANKPITTDEAEPTDADRVIH